MKNLQKLFEECKKELDEICIHYGNIESITINTRAKKRWGQCRNTTPYEKWEDSIFTINISSKLLADEVSDRATKETIIHELLHTCKDGMNHNGKWKLYAQIVNDYYGYNIKRCSTAEEKGIKEIVEPKKINYILQCKCCGLRYYYSRMTKGIKNPENYRCGRCNGNLERIK